MVSQGVEFHYQIEGIYLQHVVQTKIKDGYTIVAIVRVSDFRYPDNKPIADYLIVTAKPAPAATDDEN